jgi:excisionase family DNA binding protein
MPDLTEGLATLNARLNPVEDVMKRLGLGRSTLYALMASGQLRSVKVGRRRLISESAIIDFIEALETGAA